MALSTIMNKGLKKVGGLTKNISLNPKTIQKSVSNIKKVIPIQKYSLPKFDLTNKIIPKQNFGKTLIKVGGVTGLGLGGLYAVGKTAKELRQDFVVTNDQLRLDEQLRLANKEADLYDRIQKNNLGEKFFDDSFIPYSNFSNEAKKDEENKGYFNLTNILFLSGAGVGAYYIYKKNNKKKK